jgi:hypothetical protein
MHDVDSTLRITGPLPVLDRPPVPCEEWPFTAPAIGGRGTGRGVERVPRRRRRRRRRGAGVARGGAITSPLRRRRRAGGGRGSGHCRVIVSARKRRPTRRHRLGSPTRITGADHRLESQTQIQERPARPHGAAARRGATADPSRRPELELDSDATPFCLASGAAPTPDPSRRAAGPGIRRPGGEHHRCRGVTDVLESSLMFSRNH